MSDNNNLIHQMGAHFDFLQKTWPKTTGGLPQMPPYRHLTINVEELEKLANSKPCSSGWSKNSRALSATIQVAGGAK